MDSIIGDRRPTLEDIKALYFTTRCLNESMRLYPQPPVLIRRALEDDVVGGYKVRQTLGRGTTSEGLCSCICCRLASSGPCKRKVVNGRETECRLRTRSRRQPGVLAGRF